MGEQVSFGNEMLKLKMNFFSEQVQGQVTDIVLSLDGNHQVSVEGGDFFFFWFGWISGFRLNLIYTPSWMPLNIDFGAFFIVGNKQAYPCSHKGGLVRIP